MLREYVKLTRPFNLALTGMAPVLGALSMWNIDRTSFFSLFVLFIIGCLSHIYGFVFNDYLDVEIDKKSGELRERPLVGGTIKRKNALLFAVGSMILSWVFALYFFSTPCNFLMLISILVFADILATIYNFTSKKMPGMDFFVASAVFFLIIFGATTVSLDITKFAIIVAFIGFIQVLFMNMINGGLKDIDHDCVAGGKTAAVALGVKVEKGKMITPNSFRAVAYIIAVAHLFLVFTPFIFLGMVYSAWQIIILTTLSFITLYFVTVMLTMKTFIRKNMRRNIGLHVIFMYALAPVMLMSLNWWIGLLAFVPPLGFLLSNLILHGGMLKPETM
ncbi:MAG: UbiA prenyltransferase family protein [Thermoplasmatales archaeon]|nr:UbiA prenyltransferase family protein [Thermoplasmatales archaeon]